MRDTLYIDGLDAYTNYGVFVHESGYNGLLEFPPLKKVTFNDWPEEDGTEVDLSDTALDSREFAITFGSVSEQAVGNMVALLSDGVYHDFDFRQTGLTRRLRMVSEQTRSTLLTLERFSLQFADDFPVDGDYIYSPPATNRSVPESGYELDGIDFSQYGIILLQGTFDDIMKMPAVKKGLLVNPDGTYSAMYDDQYVVFQPKETSIKCCMRANNWPEFWNNYYALLYNLSKPGERMLFVGIFQDETPCHYVKCSVRSFAFSGNDIWFEFDLTLRFTSFRAGGMKYILSSEDGAFIESQDEQYLIEI